MDKKAILKKRLTFVILLISILLVFSINVIPQEIKIFSEKTVIDQTKGILTYEDTDNPINLSFTFQATIAKNIVTLKDNLWSIRSGSSIKFGWNKTYQVALAVSNITIPINLTIESDQALRIKGNSIITKSRFTDTKCGSLRCKNERFEEVINSDICNPTLNQTLINVTEDSETFQTIDGSVLFDPECSLTQLKNNKVRIDFYTNYNAHKKLIDIDPTIQINDVSSANAILTNITAENNFTHLSFGSSDTDFINESNVVFYMSFDVNSTNGTEVQYDYSRNDLIGTVLGEAYFNDSGLFGGAYVFPNGVGADDWIEVPSDPLLEGFTEFTIMAWFKPVGAQGSSGGRIVSKNKGTNSDDYGLQIGDTLITFFRVSAGNTKTMTCGTATDGEWEHFVGRWDGSSLNCWNNGVKDASVLSTTGTIVDSNKPLSIGGIAGTSANARNRRFNGTIDEVMILNVSLTDQQILDIYNNQSSRFFPRGEQIFPDVNVSSDSSENRINITLNGTTNTNFDSVINISVGDQSGDDYTYGTEVNFTNNQANDITISTPNNISLKFIFYAGNRSLNTDFNSFITPNLVNDIVIDSWEEVAAPVGGPFQLNSARAYLFNNGSQIVAKFGKDGEVRTSQFHFNNTIQTPTGRFQGLMHNGTDFTVWLTLNGSLYLKGRLYALCTQSPLARYFGIVNESNHLTNWWNISGSMCINDRLNQSDTNLK